MPAKLTKLAHSSLLLETGGTRVLFDPGMMSAPADIPDGLDIVVVTHAHGDHYHPGNIGHVVAHNPGVTLVANGHVGGLMADAGYTPVIVEGRQSQTINDLTLTALDHPHEEIFGTYGQVQNTGFAVDDLFFHPGDAFATPPHGVAAVATPVTAPFLSIKMVLDYILAHVGPLHIGVHDGVASPAGVALVKNIIADNTGDEARFAHLSAGESTSLSS